MSCSNFKFKHAREYPPGAVPFYTVKGTDCAKVLNDLRQLCEEKMKTILDLNFDDDDRPIIQTCHKPPIVAAVESCKYIDEETGEEIYMASVRGADLYP